MPGRVLVVDDNDALRAALRLVLEHAEGLTFAGEAATGAEAVARAAELQPDVVLMDLELPDISGVEAVGRMRAARPETRVVYFSGVEMDDALRAALGDDPFLSKQSNSEAIVSALRAAGAVEAAAPAAEVLAAVGVLALALEEVAGVAQRTSAAADALADRDAGPASTGALRALLRLGGSLAAAEADLAGTLRATVGTRGAD